MAWFKLPFVGSGKVAGLIFYFVFPNFSLACYLYFETFKSISCASVHLFLDIKLPFMKYLKFLSFFLKRQSYKFNLPKMGVSKRIIFKVYDKYL